MRIGVDIRALEDKGGGIPAYVREILPRLVIQGKDHQFLLFANRFKSKHKVLDEIAKRPNVRVVRYCFPNKLLNASFRFKKWPKIDEMLGGVDVMWFPTMLYAAVSPKCRTVLTMHDLSFEIFPRFFSAKHRLWHHMMKPKELCQSMDAIIAVSESTKFDLIKFYNLVPEKVARVYSGVGTEFRPVLNNADKTNLRAKYNLPAGRYILQEGSLQPRKNMIATLAAFEAWCQNYPDEAKNWRLLFAGYKGWSGGPFLSAVARSPVKDRVHIVYNIPQTELPGIYGLAEVFVWPSFYEGFGHPILEAMACGVPVITAANSSLGEVGGDAALYVDPYRVDDILEAIRIVTGNPEAAKEMRSKGLARTVEFNWDKTAKETLKVIEKAYASRY